MRVGFELEFNAAAEDASKFSSKSRCGVPMPCDAASLAAAVAGASFLPVAPILSGAITIARTIKKVMNR